MTNLKKMALGLLVAVLAVGFSAFKGEQKSAMYKYGNINGTYQLVSSSANPEDNCGIAADDPCLLESDTEHTSPFTWDTRPNDVTVVPDANNAQYVE